MFDLEKTSVFFEGMASAHPTLVQNIEIVNENKIKLDAAYHQPKQFILDLNNLLRSSLFFIENSIKNAPTWLSESVNAFRDAHRFDYEILKHLRNVSAHQKLIVPNESIVGGLYRIRSNKSYLLKLGFGDHNKPGSYSWDLSMKNTDDIFHDMLVFSSIAFMDLEHAAIGECLGITRRWFFKVKFKTESKRYNEVVDVYKLSTSFTADLLDHVCKSYAELKGIEFDKTFKLELTEHNFINTVLEVDIYPSLFSEWWEEDVDPLNFGVIASLQEAQKHTVNNEFHNWVHDNLTPDIESYRESLERFAALEPKQIFEQDTFGDFLSFISVNHWHFKKSFDMSFVESPISPSDIMMLQRFGNVFMDEYRKGKLCTIKSTKEQLNAQINKLIEALSKVPNENKI